MFELWLEGKLPPGVFPDHAMAMLMTKRQMVLERLSTLRGKTSPAGARCGERDICHAAVLLERTTSGR
jgi:hypothetical protein